MNPSLNRDDVIELFDQLIETQHRKVMAIARRIVPDITPEDARNPEDFEELTVNNVFNFEDGILSGYIHARTALIAQLNEKGEPTAD